MSIEEKQDFLRSEIIDQGYDGNQFAAFLEEQKGVVDLENLDFNELKYICSEFKSRFGGQQPQGDYQQPQNDYQQPEPVQPQPVQEQPAPQPQPVQEQPFPQSQNEVKPHEIPSQNQPEKSKLQEGRVENKKKKISLFDTLSSMGKKVVKKKEPIDEHPESFERKVVKPEPAPAQAAQNISQQTQQQSQKLSQSQPQPPQQQKPPEPSKTEENKAPNCEDSNPTSFLIVGRKAEQTELSKVDNVVITVRK